MANPSDSAYIENIIALPENLQLLQFVKTSDLLKDDTSYWALLSALWKAHGTIGLQPVWIELFRSKRRGSNKIMKKAERKRWAALPKEVVAYRAVNCAEEAKYAISWTLSRQIADDVFSEGGTRTVVTRTFQKQDIFAFFDRRGEEEIIILPKQPK